MSNTILVADDSATIRRLIRMVFKGSSVQVQEVEGGQEVLTAAYNARPDVILLDYNMPGHDGYELCRAIKNDPNLRHIPVLLLGGSYVPFDESRAQSCGAEDFVMKPFKTQVLFDKVANLASGTAEANTSAPVTKAEPPLAAPLPMTPASPEPREVERAPTHPPLPSGPRRFTRPPGLGKTPLPTREPAAIKTESGRFRPIPSPPPPPQPRARSGLDGMRRFRRPDPTQPPITEPLGPQMPSAPEAPRRPMPVQSPAPLQREVSTQPQVHPHQQPMRQPALRSEPTAAQREPSPSGPVSLDAVQQSVRVEIQKVVKQLLPSIVKTVLTDLFEERLAASLTRFGEEHITRLSSALVPQIAERIINEEIDRLLTEQD